MTFYALSRLVLMAQSKYGTAAGSAFDDELVELGYAVRVPGLLILAITDAGREYYRTEIAR